MLLWENDIWIKTFSKFLYFNQIVILKKLIVLFLCLRPLPLA